jgi:hypothetical protein
MDDEVKRLRASLLRKLRVRVKDGEEAAERHILLSVRFHRAAGLNQTEHGETRGWVQFFEEHFPKRSQWRPDDAERLWEHWRLGLVKWESPRSGVMMTHAQPEAHWHRLPDETLCVNLESMWDDFEASADSFVTLLRADDVRRAQAVERWRKRQWVVREIKIPIARVTAAASMSSSRVIMPPTRTVSGGAAPPPEEA